MHASRTQSKKKVQWTTVSSHPHPDNDPKIAAFTCFSLTPPNGLNPGVSGLDQSPHTSNHLANSHLPHRKRIAQLVCAATFGDPICIHLGAKIDSQKTSSIADTGSIVSNIKSTLVNTDYATPTTNLERNSKRRPYQSSQKLTLTIAIPCLRRNYIFNSYIADVKDNNIALDFLKEKDINIKCRNVAVTDNVTKFTSTRNNSPVPPSHSPVLVVFLDLSQIPDTALRKMIEQHSSIYGDTDFNTACTHNTTPFRLDLNLIFIRLENFALKSYLPPNHLSTK